MSVENLDHIAVAFNKALAKLPRNLTEKQAKRALRKYIARTDPAYADLSVSARRTKASHDRVQESRALQILVFAEEEPRV
ncbi:MAG: hypothetical protein RLZZ283_647 [Candidatus Parcubacteria bacterium]|jgi:hypothetical protein